MKIIVDGYNAINKLASTRRLLPNIEKARAELNSLCAAYGKAKKTKVVVVYDGQGGSWGQQQKYQYPGLKEIFTAAGEKADPVIVRMTRESPNDTVVVSEDRWVMSECVKAGATAVSPFDFEEAALRAAYESPDGFGKDDGTDERSDKKGPSKRQSKTEKRKARALKKL